MKILCISASNTQHMGLSGTSVKTCTLIERIILESNANVTIETLPLMSQRIKFCLMCGDCSEEGLCSYDKDFNEIYSRLLEADLVFFVVPHYSPLPSKLMAIFEKVNEITYVNWLKIPQFESPFRGKVAAIVGHGGMAENTETLSYYHEALIKPIANTLKACGFTVVGLNESFPMGAPFGLENDACIQPREDIVFPDILQNWELIEKRIRPLVENGLKAIER